jgi:hypothetical protein
MPQFKIRDIVIYGNSNEKEVITEVFSQARERRLYKVSIDNSMSNCLESNLIADLDLFDPFTKTRTGSIWKFLGFFMTKSLILFQ